MGPGRIGFVVASTSYALPGFHRDDWRGPCDMCLNTSLLLATEAEAHGMSLPQPGFILHSFGDRRTTQQHGTCVWT